MYLGTPFALFVIGFAYQLAHHVSRGHLSGTLLRGSEHGYRRHTDADDDDVSRPEGTTSSSWIYGPPAAVAVLAPAEPVSYTHLTLPTIFSV